MDHSALARWEWGWGGVGRKWVVIVCASVGSTSVCRPSQYSESGEYVCACGSLRRFGSEKGPLMLAEGAWPIASRGCNPKHQGLQP